MINVPFTWDDETLVAKVRISVGSWQREFSCQLESFQKAQALADFVRLVVTKAIESDRRSIRAELESLLRSDLERGEEGEEGES